jgi:serine/threonine protein kinase
MLLIGEHPNIIGLHEVLELIQDTKTTLFLVLELATGGMLFDRIKFNSICSTEEFARRYFTQLLSVILKI